MSADDNQHKPDRSPRLGGAAAAAGEHAGPRHHGGDGGQVGGRGQGGGQASGRGQASGQGHQGGGRSSRGRRSKNNRRSASRSLDMELPPTGPEALATIQASIEQGEYIVFDIETTGGNPEKNGITEIFAIRYKDGVEVDTFGTLVNPEIPIPPIVRRMTGINNQMVRGAPKIGEVMPDFIKFIGAHVLVSHNTIGDMKFVRYFAKTACQVELENFFLCTHLLVEKLVPEAPDKSLKGLAEFFKLATGELHRAEADAYVTLKLFKVLQGRLQDRSVRRIEQAVRLQGDMESGLRLGWGVKPEALDNVPTGPGLLYLRDHDAKVLFVSSALHLDREVAKFKVLGQLPRQLLRLALRSYDLTTERSPTAFAATLAEADALDRHPVSFAPVNWHQRQISALFLAADPEGVRLGVGPLEAGTLHAFGPVRDRRVATELVDAVAAALSLRSGRRGLIVPPALGPLLASYLGGRLPADLAEVKRQKRSVKLWLKPKERARLAAKVELMERLGQVPLMGKLTDLLTTAGILAVPESKSHTVWHVYQLVGGRPLGPMVVQRGDAEQVLRQSVADFGPKIAAAQAALTPAPLSLLTINQINATLWWLYNGRADSRYLPLAEVASGQWHAPAPAAASLAAGPA